MKCIGNTFKYLIDNYKYIFVGDLSIKDYISNEGSVLTNMTKRIGSLMKPYQFSKDCSINAHLKK